MKEDLVFIIPIKFDCGVKVTIKHDWSYCIVDFLIFGHSLGGLKFDLKDFGRTQDMTFKIDFTECRGELHIWANDRECWCEVKGKMWIPGEGWKSFDRSHCVRYYK